MPQTFSRAVFIASLVVLMAGAIIPADAQVADVPERITYQGTLVDDGQLVSAEDVEMTFRFFDAPSGGTSLDGWNETHAVDVRNGRFTVFLGSINDTLPDDLKEDVSEVYLEVEIDDEAVSTGEEDLRVPLHSTPFALRASRAVLAEEAMGVTAEAIDTEALAPDAVTNEKLSSASVTTNALAEGAVVAEALSPTVPTDSDNHVLTYDADTETMAWQVIGFFPSSETHKTQITPLENPMALVEALRGVRYTWAEDGTADIGVIAEELAEVLPELVVFDDEGAPEAVHYGKLTAVLIEAVKKQQAHIETQHDRMEALEDRLDRLEATVSPDAKQ